MKLFRNTEKEVANNPIMIDIACLLIKKAQECHFDLHGSEIEYNKHSGYAYLYNEDEQIVLGLEVYHYHEGMTTDDVELLFCCPVTGEEFIFHRIEDIVDEYNELVEGIDGSKEDFPDVIYFNNVAHEIYK